MELAKAVLSRRFTLNLEMKYRKVEGYAGRRYGEVEVWNKKWNGTVWGCRQTVTNTAPEPVLSTATTDNPITTASIDAPSQPCTTDLMGECLDVRLAPPMHANFKSAKLQPANSVSA